LTPISVKAKVDKPRSTVGDTVTYTVTITHSADTEISAPDISAQDATEGDKPALKRPGPGKLSPKSDAFEGFEFIEKGRGNPSAVKGGTAQEFWYRLRADLVGQYTFPAFQISFTTPDASGQKTPGQIATPKVDAEILSVLHLRGDPKDIHGIKPLTKVNKDLYPYALIILAILSLLGLINWARKKWLGKSRPASGQPAREVALSPHELALKNLNLLLAKELFQKGQFREYYFELSEIYRRYLGSRYAFPAIDWTTEEISVWLHNSQSLKEGARQEAYSILSNTDRVKFAKGKTNAEACMGDMRSIKQFISLTMEIGIAGNNAASEPKT